MTARGWWAATALVAAGIFALSSLPAKDLAHAPVQVWDKAAHAFAWTVLSFCMVHALSMARPQAAGLAVLAWSMALAVIYGGLDELHQSLVPGRHPDGLDLVADAIGASIGSLLGRLRWHRRKYRGDFRVRYER